MSTHVDMSEIVKSCPPIILGAGDFTNHYIITNVLRAQDDFNC